VLVLIVLKYFYFYSQPFNSDEPQHAHIVWGWVTGKVQYKEIFDNHTPLFHALYAPFFACFEERGDIVRLLRLGMLPLYLASLWFTYRLGAHFFSRRAGFWAATLLAAWPPYFFKMNEFRTDVLWTVIWLFALWVLMGSPLTRKRCFWAGVLFGVGFAVSMKTIMLLGLLGVAALATAGLARLGGAPSSVSGKEWAIRFACSVAGALIVPLLVVAYFAARNALPEMYYCIFVHSAKIGLSGKKVLRNLFLEPVGLWLVPAVLVAVACIRQRWFQLDAEGTRKRLILIFCSLFFCPLLIAVWMVATSQGFLPWYPLMAIVLSTLLIKVTHKVPRVPLLAILLAFFVWVMVIVIDPLQSSNQGDVEMIQEAITLTEPHEFVLDPKGETVYRNRPYYYVFETFTRRRLKDGTLDGSSDLIQDLIRTRTTVICASNRYPREWSDFMDDNYIRVGHVNVLGKKFVLDSQGRARVEIVIPERYTALVPGKGSQVLFNGKPLDPHQLLEPGSYEIEVSPAATGTGYLLWTRAVEKGFRPQIKSPKRPKSPDKTFVDYVREYIR